MSRRMTDVVDTSLESSTVQVSTLAEAPRQGWVYLRLISHTSTIEVSLLPSQVRQLAQLLQNHALRVIDFET